LLHTKTQTMKTALKISAILFTALILHACGNDNARSSDNDTTAMDSIGDSTATNTADSTQKVDANDETTFLTTAAIGGMMEVEAANAAASQSKNQKVKEFALLMLKDHGKANQEVAMLAKKFAIAIPKTLPEDQMMHLKGLQSVNDHKFDQQYITMMLSDHAKTVKLFAAGENLTNADLKAFAAKTLPIIQSHYDKAVAIGKTLNLSNTGNGDDIHGASPAPGHTN
jgi:putative membrane protein